MLRRSTHERILAAALNEQREQHKVAFDGHQRALDRMEARAEQAEANHLKALERIGAEMAAKGIASGEASGYHSMLHEQRDELAALRQDYRDLMKIAVEAKVVPPPPPFVVGPQPDFAAREEMEDDEWDAKFRQSESALRTAREHTDDIISAQAFQAAASALQAAGAPNGNVELFNSDN